jgi:hypothetical protein
MKWRMKDEERREGNKQKETFSDIFISFSILSKGSNGGHFPSFIIRSTITSEGRQGDRETTRS